MKRSISTHAASHPIDPRAGLPLLASKRPVKGRLIDMVQQESDGRFRAAHGVL
jgi:hypothetical protein